MATATRPVDVGLKREMGLIAGVIIIILALVHAELGGMFPVAGGTARFPHLAYGSGAGISFGFFSWLQAVTVAPIECFAVRQ